MNRSDLAAHIASAIRQSEDEARRQFASSSYFVIDGVLPEQVARSIFEAFPATNNLMLRKSIRELKYVTSQMDRCKPLVEECVFAFQDRRVVDLIGSITGLERVEPDERLYAGGISVMGRGHYLLPHIDNSHDMDRKRYRVLNLLYYTSPDWPAGEGGNLELWPNGMTAPHTIHAKFNRLLVIATNRTSWHSVSKVERDRLRTCVSNYYFSPVSPEGEDYFHVTSFRGRPENPLTDTVLRADALLRNLIRKMLPGGAVKTKHYYKP